MPPSPLFFAVLELALFACDRKEDKRSTPATVAAAGQNARIKGMLEQLAKPERTETN
ncbi:MAG: hypothetical protein ACREOO_33020 [bacterium]